jgi:hypothetical protein
MTLRVHLVPALGHKKLDAIKSEHVQRLKCDLEAKSPKTVNNVLSVLSMLLKKAVEWEVIERMPCTVKPATLGSSVGLERSRDGTSMRRFCLLEEPAGPAE